MIKILLNFLILSFAIGLGIRAFRHLTGKEKWNLTKLVAYSVSCAILAVVILVVIVFLF